LSTGAAGGVEAAMGSGDSQAVAGEDRAIWRFAVVPVPSKNRERAIQAWVRSSAGAARLARA
jgi:hypothetical protein